LALAEDDLIHAARASALLCPFQLTA